MGRELKGLTLRRVAALSAGLCLQRRSPPHHTGVTFARPANKRVQPRQIL